MISTTRNTDTYAIPPDGGDIARILPIPLLFQANENQTANESKPINPGTWINSETINLGLVIKVPYSPEIAGSKVQGRCYLNGWNDFENVPKKAYRSLFERPQKVPTGALDVYIPRSDLTGYDVPPKDESQPVSDTGFWIEYWSNSNENIRSKVFWAGFNTQEDVS